MGGAGKAGNRQLGVHLVGLESRSSLRGEKTCRAKSLSDCRSQSPRFEETIRCQDYTIDRKTTGNGYVRGPGLNNQRRKFVKLVIQELALGIDQSQSEGI